MGGKDRQKGRQLSGRRAEVVDRGDDNDTDRQSPGEGEREAPAPPVAEHLHLRLRGLHGWAVMIVFVREEQGDCHRARRACRWSTELGQIRSCLVPSSDGLGASQGSPAPSSGPSTATRGGKIYTPSSCLVLRSLLG